ncbi:MAG: hypothetical protein GY696_25435 [Gammaproteobacteria bacterium]|nr:hypothetical protein [Gammaproteobacteria bacterium]
MANNGPDMQHLPAGQKLEGYVVSETKGTAQVPASGAQQAIAQENSSEGIAPQINELEESENQDFSKLLMELEIPENKLQKAHPQIKKRVKALLYQYQDIFSRSTLGCTSGTKPGTESWQPTHPTEI